MKSDKWTRMYLDMAVRAAEESHAVRKKVGAIFVSEEGVMSIGINGMPAGGSNICEHTVNGQLVTKDEVSHAEENLLTKMLREGLSAKGGTVYCTLSPCVNCAKMMVNAGIKQIWYLEEHNAAGINYTKQSKTQIGVYDKFSSWQNNEEDSYSALIDLHT